MSALPASADVVVVGAGHNGLAAATRLAQAGKRVALVERAAALGGVAALDEFHPGFRVPGIQHGTTGLQPHVVDALGLHAAGLAWREQPPSALAPEPDGVGLVFLPGVDTPPLGLADRSRADRAGWSQWRALVESVRPLVRELLATRPPDVRGGWRELLQLARPALGLRRLGARAMTSLLRVVPMAVEDHLAEHFGDPLLRAYLASRAIEGGFLGPRSAGTAALLLLREAGATRGIAGGPAELTERLVQAAKEAGATLAVGAEVVRIAVEGGRVSGVELTGGARVSAPAVVSAAGVTTTLVGLVPADAVPVWAREAARRIRARGSTAAVRLALSRPLAWRQREGEDVELARVASSTVALERAFDRVKHRQPPEDPWLDVYQASAERPGLAPAGAASVSVLVHCAARDVEGGWTDERRADLEERVLAALERCAPGTREALVGSQVLDPPELGRRYALDGAHPHHADLGLDQLFLQRPNARFARHAAPVAGLWLAGRATHPGSDFLGSSGVLAAEALLDAE